MSRSVRIPTSRPSSTTGTEPTSSSFITSAASASDWDGLATLTLGVITSRTCFVISSSLLLSVASFVLPAGPLPRTARSRFRSQDRALIGVRFPRRSHGRAGNAITRHARLAPRARPAAECRAFRPRPANTRPLRREPLVGYGAPRPHFQVEEDNGGSAAAVFRHLDVR